LCAKWTDPPCRFFKEYPHPDDKQRKELSRELGLEPLQVKFWFQNKRTQMKVLY
jgi:homeobox-leucine zipper protein